MANEQEKLMNGTTPAGQKIYWMPGKPWVMGDPDLCARVITRLFAHSLQGGGIEVTPTGPLVPAEESNQLAVFAAANEVTGWDIEWRNAPDVLFGKAYGVADGPSFPSDGEDFAEEEFGPAPTEAELRSINELRMVMGLDPLTADGWNPVKQWRAKKGQEGGGRFIEMPDIKARLPGGKGRGDPKPNPTPKPNPQPRGGAPLTTKGDPKPNPTPKPNVGKPGGGAPKSSHKPGAPGTHKAVAAPARGGTRSASPVQARRAPLPKGTEPKEFNGPAAVKELRRLGLSAEEAEMIAKKYNVISGGGQGFVTTKKGVFGGKIKDKDWDQGRRALLELESAIAASPNWRRRTREGKKRYFRVDLDSSWKDGNVAGSTTMDGDSMYINQKSFDTPVRDVNEGWHTPSGAKTVGEHAIHHEFGHMVDMEGPNGSLMKTEVWERAKKMGMSRYGKTSAAEGYAEAYALWSLGQKDHPLAKLYAQAFGWDRPQSPYTPFDEEVNRESKKMYGTLSRASMLSEADALLAQNPRDPTMRRYHAELKKALTKSEQGAQPAIPTLAAMRIQDRKNIHRRY